MTLPHVPVLSQKNVEKIEGLIADNNIDAIVEYGSGNSTIYFLNKYKDKHIKFISVENTKPWFYKNIKTICSRFTCRDISITRQYWQSRDYAEFYAAYHEPYTPIKEGKSRVERWKKAMALGPFFRFEPNSGSRFQGKLNILRPVFLAANNVLRKLPKYANEDTSWTATIQNCKFFYELVAPSMKDQFGESPNRETFVHAGLKSLTPADKNVLVMIDAGPRHYIVDEVMGHLKGKTVHLCLFDAHRPEYTEILDKYAGKFYGGNSALMDGTTFYDTVYKDAAERRFILDHELWYYCSAAGKH